MDLSRKKPVPRSRERKRSIRWQLLLAVNIPLAVLVSIFLGYDYARELRQRLDEKRIALNEEAKTMFPAVLQFRDDGPARVQDYIDSVCGQMQDADSPGHHIAVELDGQVFQASAHHRSSPAIVDAMREAVNSSRHVAAFGSSNLIVGHQERDGASVYVSESLENLQGSVLADMLRRLAGIAFLTIVAGVAVNRVLFRVVRKPLDRLVEMMQQIGRGNLGIEVGSFSTKELDYLARALNSMSASLAVVDRQRQSQMNRARQIQSDLCPRDVSAPGLQIASLFDPADEVGGDYFDVVQMAENTWLFCVADVTGHGVPAAMAATMIKTLVVQASQQSLSPAGKLSFINEQLLTVSPGSDFVTMVLVEIDLSTRQLSMASAGHEPIWIMSADGAIHEFFSTGTVLGIDPEATWESTTEQLRPGDRILMVTDGVSETFSPNEALFGRWRIPNVLKEYQSASVSQSVMGLKQALVDFRSGGRQTDDVTAVLIDVEAEAFLERNDIRV
ncbi:MAG: hypothetical protein CMK32_06750 [Porticoccaceae bacterium]|nr:hypothetical protein [Porticoccaceae bacterium]